VRAKVEGIEVFEDFVPEPALRWEAFGDESLGGRSTVINSAVFEEDGIRFARLEGRVAPSRAGGFVQLRAWKPGGRLDAGCRTRLVVVARALPGFHAIRLRTPRCALPWSCYAAPFPVGPGWTELSIPFDAFEAEDVEPGPLETGLIRSLSFVAMAAPGAPRREVRLDIARVLAE